MRNEKNAFVVLKCEECGRMTVAKIPFKIYEIRCEECGSSKLEVVGFGE